MARFDSWILGILIFSVIATIGVLLITDINTNYSSVGVSIDTSDFSSSFNKVNDAYQTINKTGDNIKGSDTDTDTAENSLFKAGFKTLRDLIFGDSNVFSITGAIIMDISTVFGIPPIITTAAVAAMIILLFFAVIYLIFRFIPR